MVVSLMNNQPLEKIEYYILANKKPVKIEDALEWAKWFEEEENWYVAKFIIDDSQVITFFQGLITEGLPKLFQTMVVGGELERNRLLLYMARSRSWS